MHAWLTKTRIFLNTSQVIESLSRLSIVMEYAAGGDMETRIQKRGAFTDVEGKIIFAQLVSAIKHLVCLQNYYILMK